MKRVVLTNNKKVKNRFEKMADVRFMENASAYDIYEESRKVVERGGKLLMDPTAGSIKSYYKSLVLIDGDGGTPDRNSLEMLSKCLQATRGEVRDKEPLLAGIMQNREVDTLKRILA